MTGFANAICNAAFCFAFGAAEASMHAAVQRERDVKIVPNETGSKKFLLNLFCLEARRAVPAFHLRQMC
jgi:hypothetical protein